MKDSMKVLCQIPGVGKTVAQDLYQLGIRTIHDLYGKDPEILYVEHNNHKGAVQDICMLYTFQCAVYFAETIGKSQDPEKLKWWNWKGNQNWTSKEMDIEIRKRKMI